MIACKPSSSPVVIKRRAKPLRAEKPLAALHPLLESPLSCTWRRFRRRLLPGALDELYPFESLRDIASAADRLAGCIHVEGCILVVGDYDADGATGSAFWVRGLRALGASRVSYLIPSRFTSGYGLGPAVVDAAAGLGADLIITVDNGISSLAGVRWAYGLDIPCHHYRSSLTRQ